MFSPKFVILALCLFAAFHPSVATYYSKKPICAPCRSGRECETGKCWGIPGKCTSGGNYQELVKCGFKAECETCTKSLTCATEKCWGPGNGAPKKCTFDTKESRSKCFPAPKKQLCAPCKEHDECESGKCWGLPRKCTPVKINYDQLVKCGFKKECETCEKEFECATNKCWGPGNGAPKKCTFDNKPSQEKCFPAPKKPLCAACKEHDECESGKCWGLPRKCTPVKDDYIQLAKCGFKKECETCEKEFECATKKCWGPGNGAPAKCTYDTPLSKEKCFPSPKKSNCAPCSSHSHCLSGKCWGSPSKCVPKIAGYAHLLLCKYKKHCEACTSGLECATKICSDGVCKLSKIDVICRTKAVFDKYKKW